MSVSAVYRSLPEVELWTPNRSMLSHNLPLISHQDLLLDRLKGLSVRRHETAAMRRLWRGDHPIPGLKSSRMVPVMPDLSEDNKSNSHRKTAPARLNRPTRFLPPSAASKYPNVKVSTLSPDWLHEIQKKVQTPRLEYSTAVEVKTDRDAIKRSLRGKYFCKNASQTLFLATVPRYKETYTIHPEFDSEYQKCWDEPKRPMSKMSSYISQLNRVKTTNVAT